MTSMTALEATTAAIDRVAAFFDRGTYPAVISVYFFGSRAEGREHRESDLDLGILLDRSLAQTRSERFDIAVRLASQFQADTGTGAVDLVVLNDAPPLFARRIVTEGRRVYCRDSEIDHAFVRDVQLRAADLQPFLERMQAIKLEALAPR
jgi:predicted nucleotidyltransferase